MKKVLLLAFCCLAHFASAQLPSFVTDSLDTYIQRGMKSWNIPGVSVAIVKDGKPIYVKGFGVTHIDKGGKVDENTLFMIGSNTKAFTGTLLAMLEQEETCNLNDKVQKYLPDFTMSDPWIGKEMTLVDLVSHRMGMSTFQGDFLYIDTDFSRPDVVKLFGKITPNYGFRSRWGYTNAGFVVAGECIKSMTGKPWEIVLKEKIFTPLGMTRSLALTEEIKTAKNACFAHSMVGGSIRPIPYGGIDNIAEAASISSSANEMSLWLTALLANVESKEAAVIPKAAIDATRVPRSILGRSRKRFNTSHFNLYGLGWFLEDYEGREVVAHTGGIHGFLTAVTLVPEENLGVVVLTNTDANGFYTALKSEIVDAFLDLPYRGYSDLALKGFKKGELATETQNKKWEATLATKPKPALKVKAYAGTYRHPIYGTCTLAAADNYLKLSFEHHPNLKGRLDPLGENQFLVTYSPELYGKMPIDFVAEGKKVKAIKVKVAPYIDREEYLFEKEN